MCLSVPNTGPCVCDWLFRLCPEDQMCLSVPNTGPCVCDWLFKLCPEDQMCLSVPNTGLVPVCVIGYLD